MRKNLSFLVFLTVFLLLFFCQLSYADGQTSAFSYYLDLNITPTSDVFEDETAFFEIDTNNIYFSDVNCISIFWKDVMIERKIVDFNSSSTKIFFPVKEKIDANSVNRDYRLYTGCSLPFRAMNIYSESREILDDFNDNSYAGDWDVFDQSACSTYAGVFDCRFTSGSISYSFNEHGSQLDIDSSLVSDISPASNISNYLWVVSKNNFVLKNSDSVIIKGSCGLIGNSGIMPIKVALTNNPADYSSALILFENFCPRNDVFNYELNLRRTPSGIESSANGSGPISLHEDPNSYKLGFYSFNSTFTGDGGDVRTSRLFHNIYSIEKYNFVEAKYPVTGGTVGDGFNYNFHESDANILYPSSGSLLTGSSKNENNIIFSYSDPDENQEIFADIGFHIGDVNEFEYLIVDDLHLNDLNVCNDYDLNSATEQTCYLDWNAFDVNDRNVFIDLKVFDSNEFNETVISSNKFTVDNSSPSNIYALLSERDSSDPKLYFRLRFDDLSIGNEQIKDNNFSLRYSCIPFDSNSIIEWIDYNSLLDYDLNAIDSNFNCADLEGERKLFLQVSDWAGLTQDYNFSFTLDYLPEIILDYGFLGLVQDGNIDYLNGGQTAFFATDSWPGGIDFNSISLKYGDSNEGTIDCNAIERGFHCLSVLDLNFENDSSFNSGFLDLNISASSAISQKNTASFSLYIDSILPVIESNFLDIDSGKVFEKNSIFIDFNISDFESGISSVEAKLNDEILYEGSFDENVFSFSFSEDFVLENGTYALSVLAFDRAGNNNLQSIDFSVEVPNAVKQAPGPAGVSGGGSAGGIRGGGIGLPKRVAKAIPAENELSDEETETEFVLKGQYERDENIFDEISQEADNFNETTETKKSENSFNEKINESKKSTISNANSENSFSLIMLIQSNPLIIFLSAVAVLLFFVVYYLFKKFKSIPKTL